MLRVDQIDLDGVVRARAATRGTDQPSWWLDLVSGAIQRVPAEGSADVDASAQQGGWQPIHWRGRGRVYPDMCDFVDQVPDPQARDRLDRAICGRGLLVDREAAARRFEAAILRFPQLREAWAAFRDARARRDTLRWLAKMNHVDPAEAERVSRAHPDPPPPVLGRVVDAEAIAKSVAVDLRALYGPRLRQVVLFGSYARGTADEESDVDLLVVLDQVASVYDELNAMDDIMWRHTYDNDVAVSAVAVSEGRYRAAATPFLYNVAHEGRLVS